MIEVFLLNLKSLKKNNFWITEKERLKSLNLKNPIQKNTFEISRGFLRKILKEHYHSDSYKEDLSYKPKGKPYLPFLEEEKELFFSISHSRSWVTVAFSKSPLGLDLEDFDRILSERLKVKAFQKEELNWIQNSKEPHKEALKLWTRKEALLKATGKGLSYGLTRFSVLKGLLELEGQTYRLFTKNIEGGVLSVAGRHNYEFQMRVNVFKF